MIYSIFFLISSTNISATSLYFSHVPAEDVHVVSWNRERVAEPEKRRLQAAAAGGGREAETVNFFLYPTLLFFKNIWKEACCGHGLPVCPSAGAAPRMRLSHQPGAMSRMEGWGGVGVSSPLAPCSPRARGSVVGPVLWCW